jgi:hypothetical protein
MPIRFACTCGKQLQARDEYAGRRIKCPNCEALLNIPAGSAAPAPPPPAAKPPALPPLPKSAVTPKPPALPVPAPAAPSRAKTSPVRQRDNAPVVIQAEDEDEPVVEVTAEAPRPGRKNVWADKSFEQKSTDWDDDEDDFEEEERPRRKGKGKGKGKRRKQESAGMGVWLWVGIAAAVLVVLGGGVATFLLWPRGGASGVAGGGRDYSQLTDLDLVPRDAAFFATYRVADSMKLPTNKAALEQMPPEVKQFEQKLGLTLEDIESGTYTFQSLDLQEGPKGMWGAILTSKPYDKDKVKTLVDGVTPQEKKHKGYSYYVFPTNQGPGGFGGGPPGGFGGPPGGGPGGKFGPPGGRFGPPGGRMGGPPGGGGGPRGGLPGQGGPPGGGQAADKSAAVFFASDKLLVITTADQMTTFLDFTPNPQGQGGLAAALKVATESKPQTVLAMSPKMRESIPAKKIQEIAAVPFLKPYAALLDAQSALLTIHQAADFEMKATLSFADEAKAKAGQKAATAGIGALKGLLLIQGAMLKQQPGGDLALKAIQTALGRTTAKQKGNDVEIVAAVDAKTLENLQKSMQGVVGKVQNSNSQLINTNNMKQLSLALHNYVATNNNTLPPPAIYSKDGRPLLSWRVAILPFIEQDELYRQFKLDEPWDSAHNIKLLDRMPKVFRLEGFARQPSNKTHFQVFTGPNTPFKGPQGLKFPAEVTDGTSNTFGIVEAKTAVNWTQPVDIPVGASGQVPALGAGWSNGFLVSMLDGTVRMVRSNVNPTILRSYVTPSGGEAPQPLPAP